MESIEGEKWLAEYARWVRSNEVNLGGSLAPSLSSPSSSSAVNWINPVNWMAPNISSSSSSNGTPPTPLRLNPHHLYYLLIRAEAAGILVGPMDVKAPSSSRPSSYFAFVPNDAAGAHKVWNKRTDDTMSLSSGLSIGALSNFTIGSTRSWWGGAAGGARQQQASNPIKDIKYVYSALTKIPALQLGPPPPRLIRDFEDCPGDLSVPIDCFKNVQSLSIEDVDPRTLLGWDRASMQLRSLTLKRSGLEDVSELLVDCVINDAKRRRGEKVRRRERRIHRPMMPEEVEAQQGGGSASSPDASKSHHASQDPSPSGSPRAEVSTTDSPPPRLPVLSWHFLKHLNLADNSLTFLASTPLYALTSLVSLDLSNNLLNAIPPSLVHVPTLLSLDVSGNLIDSVLGIPETLPSIQTLNLARNRLESLCGLERLTRLQRVDLRKNEVYNAGEVGRLAAVESVREVWIKGNPLMEEVEDPRVDVYVEFAKDGRDVGGVKLDGEAIGYFERQRVAARVPRALGAARGTTPAASEGGASGEADSMSASVGSVARESAPVKAVRHRAGHHHLHTHGERAAGNSSKARQGTMGAKAAPSTVVRAPSKDRAGEAAAAASGTGATGEEIVTSAAAAAKRRNRRLVELDSADSMPVKGRLGSKRDEDGKEEAHLSDSDAVKRAALEGRTEEALGEASTPIQTQEQMHTSQTASASASAVAPASIQTADAPSRSDAVESHTPAPPAPAQASAPTRTRPLAGRRISNERPKSMLAPGSMSLSRKTGAAAALLTWQSQNQSQTTEAGGDGGGGGEREGVPSTSPTSLTSTTSDPRISPPFLPRRSTAGSIGSSNVGAGSSSTVGRRAGLAMLRRSTTDEGSTFGASPSTLTTEGRLGGGSGETKGEGEGLQRGEATSTTRASGKTKAQPEVGDKVEEGAEEDESSPKSRIRVGRRANASAIAARRSKRTTSMYEASPAAAAATSGAAGNDKEGERLASKGAKAGTGRTDTNTSATTTTTTMTTKADDFRRRIEALRGDVGDDWLRVLARGESVYVPREEDEDEEEGDQVGQTQEEVKLKEEAGKKSTEVK